MPKLGIDVSSYQGSSVSYFQNFKKLGADFAVVKLTEGTNYLNPKANAQVINSLKVFGAVSVYHFFQGYGTAEAKYFLAWVKKYGLDKSTVLVIDVEAPGLPYNSTPQVNVFLKYLIDHGYKNVVTYGSASWFNGTAGTHVIHRPQLIDKHIWVASYGASQPGVANANAWQFSDNWHGVDASYDFDGSLSGSKTSEKPSYYVTPGLYQVRMKWLPMYNSMDFKKVNKRSDRYGTGSRFWATPVKHGKITRLYINGQGYVSSNKWYVKFLKKSKPKTK
ncbi:MAG: autolysin [Lactobacillus sp.]|nr:MAG: autolysin [Lactobacillus sp.]